MTIGLISLPLILVPVGDTREIAMGAALAMFTPMKEYRIVININISVVNER